MAACLVYPGVPPQGFGFVVKHQNLDEEALTAKGAHRDSVPKRRDC